MARVLPRWIGHHCFLRRPEAEEAILCYRRIDRKNRSRNTRNSGGFHLSHRPLFRGRTIIPVGCLAAIGIVSGALLSICLRHVLSRVLFGIAPDDPIALIMAAAAVTVAAGLASYMPTRRAGRLPPQSALRGDAS
jgi:hypothetical protein